MLLKQKEKAEEQRDKLLDSQAAHVVPALAALTASMEAVHEVMAKIVGMIQMYGSMVEEMRNANAGASERISEAPALEARPAAGDGAKPGAG
jgi:hypothetical protein